MDKAAPTRNHSGMLGWVVLLALFHVALIACVVIGAKITTAMIVELNERLPQAERFNLPHIGFRRWLFLPLHRREFPSSQLRRRYKLVIGCAFVLLIGLVLTARHVMNGLAES